MTTDAIARRMSVNHSVCQLIDLEREIGEVMRSTSGEPGWLTIVAEHFGDVARVVYLSGDPVPTILRLAAACHAWVEAIEQERAR